MIELFNAAFSIVNLPYTILLLLVVGYWTLYILGAVGDDVMDFFGVDFDADVDVDADADVDVDADADADVGAHGGWLMPLLQFFHVGELPVVFIFSILILAMWVISLATNRLLGNTSGLVALVLFIPILFVGLVITKSLIMPFAPYISKIFSQKGDTVKVVGRTCTITSMQATPEYGSAEVTTEGAPLQLNVRTREGVTLSKGDEAVVCERDKENGTYLVAKLDLNAPSANSEE